jgi:hypothetical protein
VTSECFFTRKPNPHCRIRPRVLIPSEGSEIEFCRKDGIDDVHVPDEDDGGDSDTTLPLEGIERFVSIISF